MKWNLTKTEGTRRNGAEKREDRGQGQRKGYKAEEAGGVRESESERENDISSVNIGGSRLMEM